MNEGFWKKVETISDEARAQAIAGAATVLKDAVAEYETAKKQEPKAMRKKTNLFGFESVVEESVPSDTGASERRVSGIRDLLERHNANVEHVAQLRQRFVAMGFSSVVVIAKSFFNALCARGEIFRFAEITKEGNAPTESLISGRAVWWAEWLDSFLLNLPTFLIMMVAMGMESGNISFLGIVAGFASAAVLSLSMRESSDGESWALFAEAVLLLALSAFSFGYKGGAAVAVVVFAVVVWFVTLVILILAKKDNVPEKIAKGIIGQVVAWQVKKLPLKKKLLRLWPEMSDRNLLSSAVTVLVKFPEAPASFLKSIQLLIQHQCRPLIAAHWSAISVDSAELGVLARQEADKLKFDPILATEDGEHVVIVDSFGEIPEEEKLLAFAKEESERMMKIPDNLVDSVEFHQN